MEMLLQQQLFIKTPLSRTALALSLSGIGLFGTEVSFCPKKVAGAFVVLFFLFSQHEKYVTVPTLMETE